MSNLCYATIQRKILPQLAGLMTLEKQGFIASGGQVYLYLEFDRETIQDAVEQVGKTHGLKTFHQSYSSFYIGEVKVTFLPNP